MTRPDGPAPPPAERADSTATRGGAGGPTGRTQLLDGKSLAADIRSRIARRLTGVATRPGLLLLRVGEDPASVVYVRSKEKFSQEVGIASTVEVLPAETTEAALLARIRQANADPSVHALLVQLPLPPHIRADAVADTIAPEKDVDGLTPSNQGRLAIGRPHLVPCTPLGILALLQRYEIRMPGSRVAVLGRSAIVGRPMALLLGQKAPWADATVTLCHSRSGELQPILRECEVVIAAMGQPARLRGDQIRPGAAVIDVGIHRVDDPERPGKSKLIGDVDAPSVEGVAAFLSPVPGGVGPLTVAMLLGNTVFCYESQVGRAPVPVQSVLDLALRDV